MESDYQETITTLVCECKKLEQQLKKKDEVIEKAIEYIQENAKIPLDIDTILNEIKRIYERDKNELTRRNKSNN